MKFLRLFLLISMFLGAGLGLEAHKKAEKTAHFSPEDDKPPYR